MSTALHERSLQTYTLVWAVAGAAVLALAGWLTWSPADPAFTTAFWLLAGVTAVAELIELNFQWSNRASSGFTLVEAGAVATLLLLPAPDAVLATTLGVAVSQILRRRELPKLAYNVGHRAVAVALAAATIAALPTLGPVVQGTAVLSVIAGMVAYAIIDFGALIGLLRRLIEQDARQTIKDHGWLTAVALGGNTAVGVIFAGLWETHPDLLPFLLVPTLAIHLAYRGAVRTNALLTQLRTEHERMDRVVLGTSDGIVLLDRHGAVELWNRAMEQMTGISASAAVGASIGDVLTDDVRDGESPTGDQWLLPHARQSDPIHHEEATLTHTADDSQRMVRESHTFLFDDRGRCIGDVVLISDVTRQREVEQMKGDFVARVSHELRTPLTPIKGFTEVLLSHGENMSDEQRDDALQRIADRTERMTQLVEDLLLVTSLDDTDASELVSPRHLDLSGVVGGVIGRFRADHPDRRFYLASPPGIGPALADPDRVGQIIEHLLDNAVRYTPDETPIEVEIFASGDDVGVKVIDHGPGIPLDKHDAVFERFHRLEDPLRMKTGGVGLGLFIGRQLAEVMHGSLTVSSPPGRGASFTLSLPAANPVPQLAASEESDESRRTA